MAAVGADAAAVEGMRVVATEAGRSWDMNKGKRGDPSGGASGSIVEVREGGKWDLGGDPLPYPTGMLGRFYLTVAGKEFSQGAEEAAIALVNESLSLSLIDADDEPSSSPMLSRASLLSPSPAASGRKRRGVAGEEGESDSPKKKPSAAKKDKGKGRGKGSAQDAQEQAAAGSGDVAPSASAPGMQDEEEHAEDTPDSIALLIDGKWQRVVLAPASADSALSRGEARCRVNSSTQGVPTDLVVIGREARAHDVVDDELSEEAVAKDASTFSELLERAQSSGVHLSSLAELTRLWCYMERDFDVDARFFDRAVEFLEAPQLVHYMRHHIDAALTAMQPSADDELERERRERDKAFADEMEEEEEEADSDNSNGPSRCGGKAKRAGRGSKGSRKGKASTAGAKGRRVVGLDKETAKAAVDAICVLLIAGCSSQLQQQVLSEENNMSALTALDLILRQYRQGSDFSSATTLSRRRSSGTGGAGGRAAMGGSFGDAVCAALAAIARLTHAGALTEEAVFVARKIAPAALAFPDDSSVRLAGAQLFAALASIDLRGRSELLAELYELMVSTDVAADARGSVRLWGGSVDGTLVCASSAALLLLCQLPPMAQPLKSREAAAASGGGGGGRGSEGVESEGGDAAEQGERVRDRSGRRKGEKEQCKDKDRRDKEKRKGDKLEKSKAKEAEAEASPAPGDEESQQLAEEGGGWGRDLCKMFFDLVGHRALGRGRSGQAKDLEMRQMLESLLDDLKKLVFIPEWPVAEVLLSAACDRLDWIVAGKKADKGTVSAQYKALAIELLGSVIQLVANHSRLAGLPLAIDLDEDAGDGEQGACRREPVDGKVVVGAVLDKYFQGHGVVSGTVVGFRECEPSGKTQHLFSVRFSNAHEEDCPWKDLFPLLRRRAKNPSSAFVALPGGSKKGGGGSGRVTREALEELGERQLQKQHGYQRLVLLYLSANPCKVPVRMLQGVGQFYATRLHWDMSEACSILLGAHRTSSTASEGGGSGGSGIGSGIGKRRGDASAHAASEAHGVDVEMALSVGRRLALGRSFLRSTPQRLHLLLSLLDPSRISKGAKGRGGRGKVGDEGEGDDKGGSGFNARLRQGVLKVLAEAVRTDPGILDNSLVLEFVRHRYVADNSALVRAAAVEILAAYSAHTRRIDAYDLTALCARSLDVSAMVRLAASNALSAAVGLGRQYDAKEKAGARVGVTQTQKSEALLRLCGLAVDQEPTVRKRSLRQLVEMWFLDVELVAAASFGGHTEDGLGDASVDTHGRSRGGQAAGGSEGRSGKGAGCGGGNEVGKVPKVVVDEMVMVAMSTIRASAAGSMAGSELCLLRRVLLRVLDNGGADVIVDPPTPKPKGKASKGGASQEPLNAPSAPVIVIGAEDETMDAGGAASVVVLGESERRVVEQRCRSVCALLVQRIVRLRPKRASSDSDEADDRHADSKVLQERLECLLGATAALLSMFQSLPHLAWSIPNVTKLIDTESVDAQALEELVGGGSTLYGLRMRILAQSALLADAVIAIVPAAELQSKLSPVAGNLEKHLAAAANRVQNHGALNAVTKCLCTLSMTTLPLTGAPLVAYRSLCKKVEFVVKFSTQRSQRLLPFVSSALLGAGALCRYLDWKVVLRSLKDKEPEDAQAAARLGKFEMYHMQLVRMCVVVLANDPDERVRRCAMQCLGGLLVHTPSLLLQESTSTLVKRALRGETDATSRQAVLEAFRIFLEEEEKEMSIELRKGQPKTGDEAVKAQRVSSMSTSLANDYLQLIINAAFPHSSSKAAGAPAAAASAAAAAVGAGMDCAASCSSIRVREEAIALIKVVVRRGLTAPRRVAPSLIALSAWDDSVATAATQVFDFLHRKNAELSQPNMIIAGVNVFVSRVTAKDAGGGADDAVSCRPLHSKAFAGAFNHIASSSLHTRTLIKGLLSALENEGRKESRQEGTLHQRARRMELLAHSIAVLCFQTLDAPLYAIHYIAAQVPMLGTIALQGLDELVRGPEGVCIDDKHDEGASPLMPAAGDIVEGALGENGDGSAPGAAPVDETGGEHEGRSRVSDTHGAVRRRPKQQDLRDASLTDDERKAHLLKASCCKGVAAALMLHLSNYLKTAYHLSDAKVRGFKPAGPIGAREASGIDVLPPFRPASLIFFPQPEIDDLSTLEKGAQVLADLMEDNAVLMGRDSAETATTAVGSEGVGAEGQGEDVNDETESASPKKRGRNGTGVKEHFRVQKAAKRLT